MNTNHT